MKQIKKFWDWIWKYNEWFFSFPIGIFLFWYATKILGENGFAVYDAGVLQKLVLGFAFFFFTIGMARLVLKLQYPELSKYNDEDTNELWERLSIKDRFYISVLAFLAFILSLSILISGI